MKQLKYRQAAVDEITTPEQLHDVIRVVKPHSWIILYTLAFSILALLFWGIFGSIPTRVIGQGILITQNGEIYDAIAPEGEARLISLGVKIGDHINKNAIVAHLSVPLLTKQIAVQQSYLDQLQNDYNSLSTQSKQLISTRETETQTTISNLQKDLVQTKEQLTSVSDLLSREQYMQKRGYVTLEQTNSTLSEFYRVKQHLIDTQNKITETTMILENFKQDWQRRLDDLNLRMIDAKRDLAKTIQSQSVSKVVLSPVTGVVTSIRAAVGDDVKGGKPVVSIATEGPGLDALVYLTPAQGQRVKVGDRAIISPGIIQKEEYGSLEGKVYNVSIFPLTIDSMVSVLHNEELAKRFSTASDGQTLAPVALKVHILPDTSTFSGYQWTSGKGPDQKILPGMVVNAEITVREQAPISLIIPGLRRLIYDEPNPQ